MLTKINKIQTRFYPPGINLIYSQASLSDQPQNHLEKQLDLFILNPNEFASSHLTYPLSERSIQQKINSIIDNLVQQCIAEISDIKYYRNQLEYTLIRILQKHQIMTTKIREKGYKLRQSIKVHAQPLTNCAFNKYGDKFATASYDRTCRIWDSSSGSLLTSIKGHRNAVFCLDFSRFSQKQMLATGSLDHTIKICTTNGINIWNFKQHQGQVTQVKFNPNGIHLLSSSFDQSLKVWDLEKGKKAMDLIGHTAQVIKLEHNYLGDLVLSGSFDNTSKIWDLRCGQIVRNLYGHIAQVNTCKFQYTAQMCATGSNDKSCILWDVGSGKKINKFQDHTGQIYDLDFSSRGQYLATCSADMTTQVYNCNTLANLHTFKGHKGQITRAIFLKNNVHLLTTGYDGIGRIWDIEDGKNVGLLEGHSEQIFSCDVDYEGQKIITCSKDNVCNLWEIENQKNT